MPTREGGGGDKGHVPQVSNTLGLRSCKPAPKRVTTSPANPRGLIYIRPPRISPPPTDPGVSPGARAQSWLAVEAASLLPFSAPKEREGLRGDKRSETRGPESIVREAGALSSREGFPGRSGEPAPKAERRGLAGHRYWPQSASLAQRESGRWGGEEVVAAALHQPRSAGGRMSPGARSGSEGTGRALGFPPRPGDPKRSPPPTPCPPVGRRSVPGGSPPPHLARSVAKAGPGPARQAGPGGARGDLQALAARPRRGG